MRLLVDARSLVDATGGVSRVARELVGALIEHATDMEVVFATTGAQKHSLDPLCHPCEGREPASTCRHGLDSCLRRNDDEKYLHVHIKLPNKIWSAGCLLNAVSFDREIEKRAGKIEAIFLPNLAFVGKIHRPYVLLLHDLSFLIEPRWFSPRMRLWHRAVHAKRLIKNATHLLAVSETTKRDAMRLLNIPEERITVIPIGSVLPEPPLTPPSQGGESTQIPLLTKEGQGEVPAGRFVLAFAGNARKNATTAIAAVEELRRDPKFQDVRLVIVGTHAIRPIGGRVAHAPTWIQQISNPSDSDLASLYANASALLYPSWYEGYGLPLHEAALFGTPCIASTAGALPETAPPGTLFVDPAKPSHWVEALRLAFHLPHSTFQLPSPLSWQNASKILENCLKSLKTD